jgi:hypothetical protein
MPSKDEEVAAANNDYTGNKQYTTQIRSIGINTAGSMNSKLDKIEKIIATKKRNGDSSYKNDIKQLIAIKNEAQNESHKAALSTGIYSPHIEEHRKLLDCITIRNSSSKDEFVGITPMGQQLYAAFNAQHAELRRLLPVEKISAEYNDLSAKFTHNYRDCWNRPLQYPHIEAATFTLFKPTTDKNVFIKQYADWFKAQTKFFVGVIAQKMEDVITGNLSVTGLTDEHTNILAYVAAHKKKHSAIK